VRSRGWRRVRLVQADELGQLPDIPLEIRSRGTRSSSSPLMGSLLSACDNTAHADQRRGAAVAGLLAGALAACSSSSPGLPYKPAVQPPGATVSAAFTIVSDRLRVEIDGRGAASSGADREARRHPARGADHRVHPRRGRRGSPVSIGFGIGSFGSMGGGVGTGVGSRRVGGGRRREQQRGREQHCLIPARPGWVEPLERARQASGHRSGRHPGGRAGPSPR